MIVEEIPAALAGERIDRVVALVTEASRAEAAGLVAAGAVTRRRRGGHVGQGPRCREGQVMAIDETSLPAPVRPQRRPVVDVAVVYVDDDVIVVDKPAGLVVHPGAGHPDGTLVNGLLARFPELAGVGEPHRPGIVHRLDIGTVGPAGRRPHASRRTTRSSTRSPAHRVERTLPHAGVGPARRTRPG